jgi:hypothetical protein
VTEPRLPKPRIDHRPLAVRIRAAHRKCEAALQAGLKHALECGRLLLEAKEQIAHGEWINWVRDRCEMPERLAQRYMRVAREFPRLEALDPANTTRVTHLSFRQALDLIARNAETTLEVPPHKRASPLDHGEQNDYLSLYPTAERLAHQEQRRQEEQRRQRQSEMQHEVNRQLETHREMQRHRELERRQRELEEVAPFDPAELGPTSDDPAMPFTPEGGIAGVELPKPMSRAEISVLREELARLMRWFERLEDKLSQNYRPDERPAQLAKMCAGNIRGLLRLTTEQERPRT